MCSNHPADIHLAESFHGTLIAWTRRVGMFHIREALQGPTSVASDKLETQWLTWIHDEERIRIVIALYIHDARFASMFHHEPLLRHEPSRLPICCSEELLSAPSAEQWLSITKIPTLRRSRFRSYAELAGIMASIHDVRVGFMTCEQVSLFRDRLLFWAREQNAASSLPSRDSLCLYVMWHECFMSLYADFDQLERYLGRDGLPAADSVRASVLYWIASPEARLCMLHAQLVQKLLEALPASLEPAIHVPRAIFSSAIAMYTYIRATSPSATFTPTRADMDLPELTLSLPDSMLSSPSARQSFRLHTVDMSVVCNAVDLLNRLGHLGISRSFVRTLEALLDDSMRI